MSATVFDITGAVRVRTGRRRALPHALLVATRAGQAASEHYADEVVAAAPVFADGVIRGAVLVVRSDAPVDSRITRLWLAVAAVVLVTLLLSVALAVGTARWVGRPLRRLQTSAAEG